MQFNDITIGGGDGVMRLLLPVVYAAILSGRSRSNSEGRCWAEDAQLEHPSIVQIERYMAFDASKTILLFLALIAMLGLCGCQFRDSNFRFTEEVQLNDGRVIKANRVIAAKPLGEIGGPGGWEPKYMSFEIAAPQSPDNPSKWESSAGLLPILFGRDPDTGEWVLLATFYTCEPWYALGRPKLPYAEFCLRTSNGSGLSFRRNGSAVLRTC